MFSKCLEQFGTLANFAMAMAVLIRRDPFQWKFSILIRTSRSIFSLKRREKRKEKFTNCEHQQSIEEHSAKFWQFFLRSKISNEMYASRASEERKIASKKINLTYLLLLTSNNISFCARGHFYYTFHCSTARSNASSEWLEGNFHCGEEIASRHIRTPKNKCK